MLGVANAFRLDQSCQRFYSAEMRHWLSVKSKSSTWSGLSTSACGLWFPSMEPYI